MAEQKSASSALTEQQLRAAKVEVTWSVSVDHRATVSLYDVLDGFDPNGEDWQDEDGNCLFTSVDDALSWADTEGRGLDWAESFVSGLESERTITSEDVGAIYLRPVEPAARAETEARGG